MNEGFRVLIVEDDEDIRYYFRLILSTVYEVECADSMTAGLSRLRQGEPKIDCILLDLRLGNGAGLEVLRSFKEEFPDQPIVVCSGYKYESGEVLKYAHEYILKPPKPHQLWEAIARTIAWYRANKFSGKADSGLAEIKTLMNERDDHLTDVLESGSHRFVEPNSKAN